MGPSWTSHRAPQLRFTFHNLSLCGQLGSRAGSDGGAERWATVCSLIASAKLNNVEPFTYLKDILQRMTEGHPMSRLDELLPWNWPKIGVKH